MAGLVDREHRQVRADPVEHARIGMAAFAKLRIVIAIGDDPAERLDEHPARVTVHPGLGRCDQTVERCRRTVRRRQNVGHQASETGDVVMAVAIDEAGQQGTSGKIMLPRGGEAAPRFAQGADKRNPAAMLDQRFDIGGLVAFHRQDIAVEKQCRLRTALRAPDSSRHGEAGCPTGQQAERLAAVKPVHRTTAPDSARTARSITTGSVRIWPSRNGM